MSTASNARGEAWASAARAQPCAVCGSKEHVKGHHIITKQELTKHPNYEQTRWDPRNMLPLCEVCHVRHHSRVEPVSMRLLLVKKPTVVQFATELGLVWWLSRTYPGWRRR